MKSSTTNYDVTFEIDMSEADTKWDISDKVIKKEKSFWENVGDFFTDVGIAPAPRIYEERKSHLRKLSPKFEFGKMGLGFFLTTNLLNPGATVIKIDTDVGVRFPSNMLLVGHVGKGEDLVKNPPK